MRRVKGIWRTGADGEDDDDGMSVLNTIRSQSAGDDELAREGLRWFRWPSTVFSHARTIENVFFEKFSFTAPLAPTKRNNRRQSFRQNGRFLGARCHRRDFDSAISRVRF
jgi:hypothetical protein